MKEKFTPQGLLKAVERGDIDTVKSMMSEQGSTQVFSVTKSNQQVTLLYYACIFACIARTKNQELANKLETIIEYLTNHPKAPDFNAFANITYEGQSALSWAAESKSVNLVKKIFETGKVPIDTKDGNGKTLLYWMVEYSIKDVSWVPLVKLCIEKGAKLSEKPTNIQNAPDALDLALASGIKSLKDAVLNTGNEKTGNTILHLAIKNIKSVGIEKVKKFLENGANPLLANKQGYTSLKLAEKLDNKDLSILVSKYKTNFENQNPIIMENVKTKSINDKDQDGNTQLHKAIERGDLNSVKSLMEFENADQNIQNNKGLTALYLACALKNTAIAQYLLDKKPALMLKDQTGQNGLSWVAELQDTFLLDNVLNSKMVDINQKDNNGKTVLSWMAEYSSKNLSWNKMIEFLLMQKADIDTQRIDGATPLYITTSVNNTKGTKTLLENKANPNLAFKSGDIPLNIACNIGNMEIIKALIEHKSNIDNGCYSKGNQPMHNAFFSAQIEVIKFLMEQKVSVNVKNKEGKLPIHYLLEGQNVVNQKITNEQKLNVVKTFGKLIDFFSKNPEDKLSAKEYAQKNNSSEIINEILCFTDNNTDPVLMDLMKNMSMSTSGNNNNLYDDEN